MKSINLPPASYLLFIFIQLLPAICFAQLPVCTESGGILYLDDGYNLKHYDPNLPVSATNPSLSSISMNDRHGLAIGPNLNAATPPTTFYSYREGYYYYHDGNQWVNTGHKASAVNLGAGGGYVYGIAPGMFTTLIYQYDGSGDDALLLTLTDAPSCLYDIIADCEGNFYVLNTGVIFYLEVQWMRKYDASGQLLYQWYLKNVPLGAGGGGFGIIDNTVFFDNLNGQFYKGVVIGDTIDFSVISSFLASMIKDMGNCPKPLFSSSRDTLFYCGENATITPQGTAPPYTYTILSGNPIISGSGPQFTVSCPDIAEIVFKSGASDCSNDLVSDTFVIVPPPVVNAGPDDTVHGCAVYRDTLAGQLINSTPWVDYAIQWTPDATISSGAQTLHPIVNPLSATSYILNVSTGLEQGDCVLNDTVKISVKDRSVVAGFSFTIRYGCDADTVHFTSESTPGVAPLWDFGDGSPLDSATNPVHIYPHQDTYTVTLNVSNSLCTDDTIQTINTAHPLLAAFAMDQDLICINDTLSFTNNSIPSNPDSLAFLWDFGDGVQSTVLNPAHQYTRSGTFTIRLMATDFVPCTDTAFATVTVDGISPQGFVTDKAGICIGESIRFTSLADNTASNLQWDFGDDMTAISSENRSFHHAFEYSGALPVTVRTDFRVCPDSSFTDTITVYPFPEVDLGPDSSVCHNGQPLYLKNLNAAPLIPYHQVWSTGDTTAILKVLHPGIYTLSVTTEPVGCTATESIEISKDCYIDIPNAFTPNGDGHNDYFLPRQLLSESVAGFQMQIFNRWGQLLFETTNLNGRGWDGQLNGTAQPTGVYLYRISADFSNGAQQRYDGNVTLIR